MPDVQEQLKDAQGRVKILSTRRDQIIREAGVEEQKLQQVYESLRQLGIDHPEKYTVAELQELAKATQERLAKEMDGLLEMLASGEALLQEYTDTQGG